MSDTIPIAIVAHTIPGRTRLRIPARRGDTVFFASLATTLSAMAGIYRVTVQPVTAGILLEHGKPLQKLLAAVEDAQLFRVSESWTPQSKAEPVTLDARLLIGVGMGAFALWQLTQGRILPPAMTLGWYAASLAGFFTNHGEADIGE